MAWRPRGDGLEANGGARGRQTCAPGMRILTRFRAWKASDANARRDTAQRTTNEKAGATTPACAVRERSSTAPGRCVPPSTRRTYRSRRNG
ncbi:hypothetical protein BVIET440_40138 [Burkholderia vietnamiensis]|nr:hypothetical protein BVI2075_400039 [Burkholderia vietnamiensis]CAG9219565.1 hypothetical protein BVI1335_3330001 [Burkholderia vietnamiensis]